LDGVVGVIFAWESNRPITWLIAVSWPAGTGADTGLSKPKRSRVWAGAAFCWAG
jgi:hypothetical protein